MIFLFVWFTNYNNKIKVKPRENLENGATVKNKAKGDVYVPPYVMKYIMDYIVEEMVDVDTNFLFINLQGEHKGQPMKPITIQKLVKHRGSTLNSKDTTPIFTVDISLQRTTVLQ